MKALAKNGLRYPIPQYGIQSDVRAGMGVSYAKEIAAGRHSGARHRVRAERGPIQAPREPGIDTHE